MDPDQQPILPKATGVNKYLQPYKNRRQIFLDNFLGGLAWSFGTFLGLGILAIITGYLISKLNPIPIIGDWLAQILEDATSRLQPPVR